MAVEIQQRGMRPVLDHLDVLALAAQASARPDDPEGACVTAPPLRSDGSSSSSVMTSTSGFAGGALQPPLPFQMAHASSAPPTLPAALIAPPVPAQLLRASSAPLDPRVGILAEGLLGGVNSNYFPQVQVLPAGGFGARVEDASTGGGPAQHATSSASHPAYDIADERRLDDDEEEEGDEYENEGSECSECAPSMAGSSASGSVAGDGRVLLHRPCSECRVAKVRCDREMPCGRCRRHNLVCKPPPTVARGRPSHHSRLMQLKVVGTSAAVAPREPTGAPMDGRFVQSQSHPQQSAASAELSAESSGRGADLASVVAARAAVLASLDGHWLGGPGEADNSLPIAGAAVVAPPMPMVMVTDEVAGGMVGGANATISGPSASAVVVDTADVAGSISAAGACGAVPPQAGGVAAAAASGAAQAPIAERFDSAERKVQLLRAQLTQMGIRPCV